MSGANKLRISGKAKSCLSFYLSIVGTEKVIADSDGKIVMINPWLAANILPSKPYVVRLVLSRQATFASDKLGVGTMQLLGKDGHPTSDAALKPVKATFENSQSIVRLEFNLAYGHHYNLLVDGTKLTDKSGKSFVQNDLITKQELIFITVDCSCLDSLHCDWGSPCPRKAGCGTTGCRQCPNGMTTDDICVNNGVIATPIPIDPTSDPKTPKPISGTTAPDTVSPEGTVSPNSGGSGSGGGGGGGGGSSIKSVLVIILLIGLISALIYVLHQKGYLSELPCFKPSAMRPTVMPTADESLFMDDDIDEDDEEDVNLNPATGVAEAADQATHRQQPEDTTGQANDDDENLFGDDTPAAPQPKLPEGGTSIEMDPFADMDLPNST